MELYTRDDIISLIKSDNFKIYENEYPIICKLLDELDDRLFVKVIEEIILGNLTWMNFKELFNDDKYTKVFNKNIEDQYNFNERYTIFMSYINDLISANKISNDISYNALLCLNKTVIDIDKRNKLYSLFLSENSNPINEIYKNIFLETLLYGDNNTLSIDNMLLSIDDYVVPVDYNYITLDDTDVEYARLNDLDLDTMKKTKAITLYFTNLRLKAVEDYVTTLRAKRDNTLTDEQLNNISNCDDLDSAILLHDSYVSAVTK